MRPADSALHANDAVAPLDAHPANAETDDAGAVALNPVDLPRLAAALLAVDPQGLGGIALRAPACEERTRWLDELRQLLPQGTPWRRLPLHADTGALLGGLDLGASLSRGQPVAQPGLLAQSHGGCLLLPMAERVSPHMAAQLAAVLDTHEVKLQREGLSLKLPARLALLALDEGLEGDETLPATLLDRLAFHLRLTAPAENADDALWQRSDIEAARSRLPQVQLPERILEGLCATSLVLGVNSLRAPLMTARAARALAALEGRPEVDEDHARLAVQMVLAPRATRLPPTPEAPQNTAPPESADSEEAPATPNPDHTEPPPDELSSDSPADDASDENTAPPPEVLEELLVQAALASLPPGLLAALKAGLGPRAAGGGAGRAGALQKSLQRGRPVGTRRGDPRSGARLHLLDTLRAAAPWQRLRRQTRPEGQGPRILVQREDFHVRQFRLHRPTTTVFVVDASGSSALHRLAEAKGAVELLLAECYVRRDRAAVVSFRGPGAEVVLPPTRSLARAKRSLAALPAGGGTPLAAGLEAAHALAAQITRQGETAVLVLLTDGRANLARDGSPGRARAAQDALAAARLLRASGITSLLIDISAQPQPTAQALAEGMGARYVPLPHAGAQALSQVVRAVTAHA